MKLLFYIILISFFFQACGSKKSSAPASSTPTNPDVLIYGSPPKTTTGTDPLGSYMWHLINTGSNAISSDMGTISENTANTDLNMLQSITQDGTNVTVLVSDDTVEHFHDDLYANWSLSESYNFFISSLFHL